MRHPDEATLARFDDLSASDRQALIDHVGACADCRGSWLADDPSRAFALLGRVDLPDPQLERLSERISSAVDRFERGAVRRGSRRRLLATASLAASLLLAVLVGGYLYDQPQPTRLATADPVESPLAAGAIDDSPPPTGLPAKHRDPVRAVELLESPGAGKLVNLTVGETRVVMIFDEDLDI